LELKDQSVIDALFDVFFEENNDVAYQTIIKADYRSSNPKHQALIYFLEERWSDYEPLDFDQGLLTCVYANANEKLQRKILKHAQINGRLEWFKLVNLNASQDISFDQWNIGTEILLINKDFKKLWKNIFMAPPVISVKILGVLIENKWKSNSISNEEYISLKNLFESTPRENELAVTLSCDFYKKNILKSKFLGITFLESFENQYVIFYDNDNGTYKVYKYEYLNTINIEDNFGSETIEQVFLDGKIIAVDLGKKMNIYHSPLNIDFSEEVENTYQSYHYHDVYHKILIFKNLSYIGETEDRYDEESHTIQYRGCFGRFLVFQSDKWGWVDTDEQHIGDIQCKWTSLSVYHLGDRFCRVISEDGYFSGIDEKYLYLHPIYKYLPRGWLRDYRNDRSITREVNYKKTKKINHFLSPAKFNGDLIQWELEYSPKSKIYTIKGCMLSYLRSLYNINELREKPLSDFSYEHLLLLEHLIKNSTIEKGKSFIDLVIYLIKLKLRYEVEIEDFSTTNFSQFDIDIEVNKP